MTLPQIFKRAVFTHQKALLECFGPVQCLQILRHSSSEKPTRPEVENSSEKKILKVAIIGRPNAGKSTLINCILKLNICGVSHKTHTTKTYFRTAFTEGDTQIVFVDTPGLVTQKEYVRFNLSESFTEWKNNIIKESDIIGVVHELSNPNDVYKLHINLIQNICEFPPTKPLFLVLNKIDLVIDKSGLSAALEEVMAPQNLNRCQDETKSKIWHKFSRIFYTSASKNRGVREIVDYLLEQAKPGEWIFEPGKTFNKPLNLVVTDLLRARLMDILPHEVPFQCNYEVEYMRETNLGEIFCVALVTCKNTRHKQLIIRNKKMSLKDLSQQLESDLFKILNKVFRIRIVVVAIKKKEDNGNKETAKNNPCLAETKEEDFIVGG